MAKEGQSSSCLPVNGEEDNDSMLYGSESGWVEARTHCDHLASLSSDLLHIPTPHTPCNSRIIVYMRRRSRRAVVGSNEKSEILLYFSSKCEFRRCEHPDENWLCLCCKDVLCSRFVNKHMLEHFRRENHCLALSFSDLSVWCFSCDAYLDAQVILPLRPVYETAYILKFGEAPPPRTLSHP